MKRVVLWMALFLCFCCLAITGWLFVYSQTPGPAVQKDTAIVSIPRGTSVIEIGHILSEAGLIHDDFRFRLLAKITRLSAKLQAGEFLLATEKKPVQVLEALSVARPVQHRLTVVEGSRAEEIAKIFAEDDWCDEEEFLQLMTDPELLLSLGLEEGTSLEGYLFPDTYYLTRSISDARSLIRMMVARFQKVWEEVEVLYKSTGKSLSRHETVILASVVEKETGAPEERPRIASVFLNRLQRGMKLQSDPTVIYGITGFSGNLTRKDLRTPSPYNTYVLPALPQGPICSPGKAALEAVVQPVSEKYLYFVSKNNGTHHFSKTLKEHNRAVWKYQKNRKKKKAAE